MSNDPSLKRTYVSDGVREVRVKIKSGKIEACVVDPKNYKSTLISEVSGSTREKALVLHELGFFILLLKQREAENPLTSICISALPENTYGPKKVRITLTRKYSEPPDHRIVSSSEIADIIAELFTEGRSEYLVECVDKYNALCELAIDERNGATEPTNHKMPKKEKKRAQFTALDPRVIAEVSEVAGFGAEKYARLDYRKGATASEYIDASMRHLTKWLIGVDNDDESGMSHMAHAMWNLHAARSNQLDKTLKEDRWL